MLNSPELATFFLQLGTLLQGGVPIHIALEGIAENSKPKKLAQLAAQLNLKITNGTPLSQAMIETHCFTPLMIQLMGVGEKTGKLDSMCQEIYKTLTWEINTQKTLITKSLYPLLLVILTLFAIPLPGFLQDNSDNALQKYLAQNLYPLCIAGLVLVFLKTNPHTKKILTTILSCIPFFSGILKNLELARFFLILSVTQHAGIMIPTACQLAIESLSLKSLKKKLKHVPDRILQGEPLAQILLKLKILPWSLTTILTVGEKAGHLDENLRIASEQLTNDTMHSVNRAITLFKPLLMIAIGGYIGLKLHGFYSQYFKLLSQ